MSLSDNIEAIHGKQGKIWMENLSSTVATLNIQLGLSQLEECTNLSYNYVLSGWQNSAPVVLK
ncbi:MAG: kinase, partial [Gammaproteobacteria bacterium]|nr:kinase [Gammaproteobacteria bacterium]